jgi:hypothetical protein
MHSSGNYAVPGKFVPMVLLLVVQTLNGATLPIQEVERQPFSAHVKRLVEAMDYLGSPLAQDENAALGRAAENGDDATSTRNVQAILDNHCLFGVTINPEMRVKVANGPAKPELLEQGWRQFLVKVVNESGTTAALRAASPNAQKLAGSPQKEIADHWLDLMMFDQQPLPAALSGLNVEYRIVQLYSRDAGKRAAKISFDVGQGTQDLGFRNETDVLFTIAPAHEVKLHIRDERDEPTTASFVITDAQGRVYPSRAKRLAPDFAFHEQIYRVDGETIRLPAGDYKVEFSRGPESVPQTKQITIGAGTNQLEFKAQRWIDPSQFGWWSGDHHIHAAGCAHYVKPTEGVLASDMIRHCMGEDLKIGANLTWGPCFDYQKQFFCGTTDKVSRYPYLLRYDIEVSGFGSHQSGHLCLLRLKEEIYPGGDSKDHWPTLGLNTLRWAKKQGAVCGPAHSGWGLEAKTKELPNYIVPPFDGIGANEYIVDVTHKVPDPDGQLVPAVDFISLVDTPSIWELNMWYHTLNVGYRTRGSGETDFPCIYGEKVGLGRSYVKLDGKLEYDRWCEGVRQGRSYVSDGKSHLLNFKVNELGVGENGSELNLQARAAVKITAQVAAMLGETNDSAIRDLDYTKQPYWNIERARIGTTRTVPLEVIVNGYPVARTNILADGKLRDIEFEARIDRSSWLALRILPSSHTNPIFVLINGKPIRASKRSAEWCLAGVDQCWSQKEKFIKAGEKKEAKQAYDYARAEYKKLVAECVAD